LTVAILVGYPYGVTLWDWIKLLIFPAVLAIGGYWLNRQQQNREFKIAEQRAQTDRRIEEQRAQETVLQAFLDQITHSNDYSELRTATASGHKRAILRAKMQILLLRLDEERKGVLLSSLHGTKLIRKEEITPYEHTKEGSEKTGKERWRYPILRLNDIDFSRTELNPDTKLTFDDLRGIILRSAKLSKVNLSGANLNNADLRDADLRGAQLRKANPQDSEWIPGEFHNEVAKAKHIRGRSASRLLETDLSGANLSEAKLGEADLKKADLRGANLRHAHLSDAVLSEADLSKAKLEHANLSGVDLEDAKLAGADLSHADLRPAHLRIEETLENMSPHRWARSIAGLDMEYGKSQQHFLQADLSFAELARANLKYADLRYANLYEANLKDADLSGANLQGATSRVRVLVSNDLVGEPDEEEREIREDLYELLQSGNPRPMRHLVPIEQLQQACSLKGATMPNGQKYEEWLKSKGRVEDGENPGPS